MNSRCEATWLNPATKKLEYYQDSFNYAEHDLARRITTSAIQRKRFYSLKKMKVDRRWARAC